MRKIETFGQLRDAINAGEIVHWRSIVWAVTWNVHRTALVVVSPAREMALGEAILTDPAGFFVAEDQDLQEARSDANPRA